MGYFKVNRNNNNLILNYLETSIKEPSKKPAVPKRPPPPSRPPRPQTEGKFVLNTGIDEDENVTYAVSSEIWVFRIVSSEK